MVGFSLGMAALAVSTVSAVGQVRAGKKAAKGQKRTNQANQRINQLKNKQTKRAFLQKFRQAQAAVLQNAVAAGVGLDSSVFQAAMSAGTSQANRAVGEFQQFNELGAEATAGMNQTSSATAQAQRWGAVGSVAQNFIAFPSGVDQGLIDAGKDLTAAANLPIPKLPSVTLRPPG